MAWQRFHVTLLLWFVSAAGAPGQEKRLDNAYPRVEDWGLLQDDPRLARRVSIDLANPTVEQVVTRLGALTGVPLETVGPELEKHRLGDLHAHNAPAWKIMRQLILMRGYDGKWAKAGNGYRLHLPPAGSLTRTVGDPEPRIDNSLLWCVTAVLGVIFVALLIVALRSRTGPARQGGTDLP